MITPVESGSTCEAVDAEQPGPRPRRSPARPRCPGLPVPALATPVLTTMRADRVLVGEVLRHTCTGAAAKRLRVKTPATRAPSSSATSSRSLRFGLADVGLGDAEAYAGDARGGLRGVEIDGHGELDGRIRRAIIARRPEALRRPAWPRPQARIAQDIDVAAVAQRVGVWRPSVVETELAVERDRARVVGEHGELEADDVEPAVGQVHEGLHQRPCPRPCPASRRARSCPDASAWARRATCLNGVQAGVAHDLAAHAGDEEVSPSADLGEALAPGLARRERQLQRARVGDVGRSKVRGERPRSRRVGAADDDVHPPNGIKKARASGELAVALLEFLARAAGARIVAPDLLRRAHEGLHAAAPPRRSRLGAGRRACRRRPPARRRPRSLAGVGVLVLHVLQRRARLPRPCARPPRPAPASAPAPRIRCRVTSRLMESSIAPKSSKASRLYSCLGCFCA